MTQLRRIFTTLLLSIVLFAGILFVNNTSFYGLAAITPREAQDAIKESRSSQEAGAKLRAGDSSEKVRKHEALDTAKEVRDRNRQQQAESNRRDDLIGTTQSKLQDAAENVKEKLNLDEPIDPNTKQFVRDVKDKVDDTFGKTEKTLDNKAYINKTQPGYYQRNR